MDGKRPSGRRRIQGEFLVQKPRNQKSTRCCLQVSRGGRSISVVRGPRRTTASGGEYGLGAGGIGEVYRARDTRLGRDVALKVLPDSFASDPERVARFQREAQVL